MRYELYQPLGAQALSIEATSEEHRVPTKLAGPAVQE
jgi:hypothetical protein